MREPLLPITSDNQQESQRMPGNVSLESAVILVVDDEPSVLSFVTRLLERYGAVVHGAQNGQAAQELAARLPSLDLLVTDVILPDIAGPALATALRARHPDMPVLVMSGYVSEEAGSLTGGAFLKKPFLPIALVESVRHALAQS